ncbi:hypothetical protein [Campylobacter geochelonis]|uniref:hypothetical protein n=1 Tax=Campylobacter geochelonis TaxID=1780362 RepID=UPI000770B1C6|nr:hypothetical protein [Campylobacter geochelonis]CZE50837.1 mobilization protein [Campylobacter geochelonis]
MTNKKTISSFHLEPSVNGIFQHNDRTNVPTYVKTEFSHMNEINRTAKQAEILYQNLLRKSIKNYTARTGQKIQTKEDRFRWSAVVNISNETTMKDLEKLCQIFKEKFGWQPLQIAIHRDEGRWESDEKGNKIFKQNLHAQIEFFMLNEDGIYCFKKSEFGRKKMSEIQDIVAETLNLERGLNYDEVNEERVKMGLKKIKIPKHLTRNQYITQQTEINQLTKKLKNQTDLEKLNKDLLNELTLKNRLLRAEFKKNNALRADYKELETTVREIKQLVFENKINPAIELLANLDSMMENFEKKMEGKNNDLSGC